MQCIQSIDIETLITIGTQNFTLYIIVSFVEQFGNLFFIFNCFII